MTAKQLKVATTSTNKISEVHEHNTKLKQINCSLKHNIIDNIILALLKEPLQPNDGHIPSLAKSEDKMWKVFVKFDGALDL